MEGRAFTTKRLLAVVALAAITIVVAFLAPPVARIVIALIALPLTAMLATSIVGGADRTLPQP